MLRSIIFAVVFAGLSCMASADTASQGQMQQYVKTYQHNTFQRLPQHGSCTKKTIFKRQEWAELDDATRLDFIRALHCMKRLPSKIDPNLAPGARNRYDDFQAAHIINTRLIHATGLFFAWHRWFVQLWETALREECHYIGYQPYWDWSRWATTPSDKVPLYDGSPTSLSGNGKYIPGRNGTLQPFPIPVANPPAIYIPPGTGGGYIYQGPLVNWTLHLGPYYNQTVKNGLRVPRNPRPDALGYNPRPMIRDFNNSLLLPDATYEGINTAINMSSIHDFGPYFFQHGHLAGHSFISGEDNDLFTSPGDPIFWAHHANVDRIWSIWQAQDFASREYALDGTLTLTNVPPSRNATLNDTMVFDFAPSIQIRTAMSATNNGMCYYYD